jgi:hypothetical protein
LDEDVESFLHSKAVASEKRRKSRTYLIIDEQLNAEGKFAVLAYFTLSLKALVFGYGVSRRMIHKIDGLSSNVKAVGTVLIGQFGKDRVLAKDINGSTLFNICLNAVGEIHNLVGSRIVLLECKESDKIVSFYKQAGFVRLQTDDTDRYIQMVKTP